MIQTNQSGIIPTEYNILVLPDDVPEISGGGILIPRWARDQRQGACVTGTIVDMADEAFTFVETDCRVPQIGERIAFAKYSGMKLPGKDRTGYLLMKDKDVAAILDFAFDPNVYEF